MASAVIVVGAVVRDEAMVSRWDVRGIVSLQSGEHGRDLTIQGVLETSHLLHERMKAEEAAQVQVLTVVHIVSVEGEYTGFAHIEPGTLQHPDLNGEVSDKDLLGARSRLDLDQSPSTFWQALDDVGAYQHTLMYEGCFKESGAGLIPEDAGGFLERFVCVPIVLGDQTATRMSLAREFADDLACVKDGLQGG